MKQPVPEDIRLESRDGRRRMSGYMREEVMPLQDLMEENAVNEPSEAQTEQDPRYCKGLSCCAGCWEGGHRLGALPAIPHDDVLLVLPLLLRIDPSAIMGHRPLFCSRQPRIR